MPSAFRHIRKLKDVKELKVEMRENKEDGTNIIICPVSKIDFNGFHPFLLSWSCGCVFSEEAAKELNLSDKCLNCGHSLDKKTDIVSLNQTPDQQQQYLKMVDSEIKEASEKALNKKLNKKRK